jgi:6-phosphogluconolactonase
MNLRIFDSTDDLIRAAARAIEQKVEKGARTIALSGGSTPRPLYTLLGETESLRPLPLDWVEVDERYVPIDDPQSNAGMIQSTLFAHGMPGPHRFLPFRTELEDPARTARVFADEWKEMNLGDLDVVILGVGDDGHTASLFPGTPALEVTDRIATEVFVEKLSMWRVTITKPVIRAAALRIVLATGESKRPILQQVREGADYPIAQATQGVETWWFVDRAAAP